MSAPLDYHTPAPAFLDPHPPAYGVSCFCYGSCAAGAALLFYVLRGSSPFSVAMLATFPLVSAVAIFGLSGVSCGMDAVSLRRETGLAVPGLVLSLLSMGMLARALVAGG